MSTVSLDAVKSFLRVTHDDDDAVLQDLIDGAEDEALQFLDRLSLPKRGDTAVDESDSNRIDDPASDSDDLAPAVRSGIYLIVQGMYEGRDAKELKLLREAAEAKWWPYRNQLGV